MKHYLQIKNLRRILQQLTFTLATENMYLLALSQVSSKLLQFPLQFRSSIPNKTIIRNLIDTFSQLTTHRQLVINLMEIFICSSDHEIVKLILDQFVPLLSIVVGIQISQVVIFAVSGLIRKMIGYHWHSLRSEHVQYLIQICESANNSKLQKQMVQLKATLLQHPSIV